jgi:hypothetical protein
MSVLTKNQEWEQVFDVVARTVDGMGRPIDRGIIGVVLGLNAHRIRTRMSCEGHLDHGLLYPWIWVPAEDQGKLAEVLNAFNHAHEEAGEQAMDHMLIILCNFIEDMCVLQNFGAACQNEREPQLKAKKLKEYQTEMQAFAEFLKERFFEDGR